ncbi:MAG: hypothetical protein IPG12_17105, partial [Saprospiraceae bacterium]|nr:hypothetical protein [Saprospiraceae bacterium]
EDYKEVTFDISPVGKFSNNNSTIKGALDVLGEAHAFIFSDNQGLAIVKANVGNLYRTTSIKFFTKDVDSLNLFISQDSVPADNYSYAEITAVTKNRPFANNQIVFVSDKGAFSNGSNTYAVQASFHDTTRAYIKYNSAELVRIRATIYNTYSKEIYTTFIPAFPSQIFVNSDVSVLLPSYTSKAIITAKLTRAIGSVSEGQIVNFYDSTSAGGSVGIF